MSKSSKKVQLSEFDEKLLESSRKPGNNLPDTGASGGNFGTEQGAGIEPDETVIPVIEEQAYIDKQTVESGKVRVSKNVIEDQVMMDIPSVHEEVDVQRIPVDEYVDQAPPAIRYEGDKMIISVLREELVLVKRIKLVEELHVINRRIEEHRTEPITLRREEVHIERLKNENQNTTRH